MIGVTTQWNPCFVTRITEISQNLQGVKSYIDHYTGKISNICLTAHFPTSQLYLLLLPTHRRHRVATGTGGLGFSWCRYRMTRTWPTRYGVEQLNTWGYALLNPTKRWGAPLSSSKWSPGGNMQYLGRLKKVPSGFTFPHWSLIPTPFFMVLICYISPFLLLFLAFYWLTAAIVVSVVSPFLGRTVQLCLKETDQHFCSSQHDQVGIPYIMSGCATLSIPL